MKKIALILTSALVLLTGCSLLPGAKSSSSQASSSSVSSKASSKSSSRRSSSRSSSSSSSRSSSSSSESNEVVSKVLVGDIEGIHHRDTITYQGKKLLTMRMELVTALPAEAQQAAATMSPEEMTAIIQEGLQSDPEYIAAKNLDGFNVEYSVTADKQLQTIVEVDFQKVNVEELEKISYFKDTGLNDIKDLNPNTFILGLKLNGLKEETPA